MLFINVFLLKTYIDMREINYQLPIRYIPLNRGFEIVDFNGEVIGRFLEEFSAIEYVNMVNNS